MIPFFGNFALWVCLFFAILQFFIYKKNFFKSIIKKFVVVALLFFSSISFLSLIYAYIVSDFSVINVFQNSHTSKPLIYKIAAAWGNHEGSMLLWILVLAIFNFFIFKLQNKKNFLFISKALEVQSLVIFGFILFTVTTSNPFGKVFPIPDNGLGFNPILQDLALAIHPPLLYVGYVGFSAVFSLALAAMTVENIQKIQWYIYMKTFVMIAWTFLTIGIAFGSIWAYYELGWGGWWFWDPVENASFIPWLLGTALLHSLISLEKKKLLQKWVLLLSILTFLLSVIGTFLVRSGILTSVHTFALDPTRGIYILLLIALLGGYSLTLFSIHSEKFSKKNYISFFTKEGSILVNNILMTIACVTVFLGTIYPLIIEAFSKNKISVGEPYYNSTVIPILIPAIIVMGIGPILSWSSTNIIEKLKKSFPCVCITILLSLIFCFIYKPFNLVGLVGITLSFWILSNSIFAFISKLNLSKSMLLAHFGIGLLILGITGSSSWQNEKIIKMRINDQTLINDYNIVFKKIKEVKELNYLALKGSFLITDKQNNIIAKLEPENRFYPITKVYTTEASIHTNLIRDLYIVLGDGNKNDGWVVRVYYNPLVAWIWIGAFTIFFGGLLSIKKNLKLLKSLSL